MRPCKIDSETFFGIFFVSVLYDCISVTYIGGCDRFHTSESHCHVISNQVLKQKSSSLLPNILWNKYQNFKPKTLRHFGYNFRLFYIDNSNHFYTIILTEQRSEKLKCCHFSTF